MLRITIELWPFGDQSKKRVIGDLCITNTGRIPDLTGTNEYKIGRASCRERV